jgi:hypothetical protein
LTTSYGNQFSAHWSTIGLSGIGRPLPMRISIPLTKKQRRNKARAKRRNRSAFRAKLAELGVFPREIRAVQV